MSDETQNPAPVRVVRLDTAGDVRRELARLYRACRRGDVPAPDGSKMACILGLIIRSIETAEIEERLNRLEGQR